MPCPRPNALIAPALLSALVALAGPLLVGDPSAYVAIPSLEPSWAHPLGTTGQGQDVLALPEVGDVVATGPLVPALQGDASDLGRLGLAGTMRRVGFQAHDARIYEMLTTRGGVLVAVHSEPRAADALALFHAYGGGNAAIGAWAGRL